MTEVISLPCQLKYTCVFYAKYDFKTQYFNNVTCLDEYFCWHYKKLKSSVVIKASPLFNFNLFLLISTYQHT